MKKHLVLILCVITFCSYSQSRIYRDSVQGYREAKEFLDKIKLKEEAKINLVMFDQSGEMYILWQTENRIKAVKTNFHTKKKFKKKRLNKYLRSTFLSIINHKSNYICSSVDDCPREVYLRKKFFINLNEGEFNCSFFSHCELPCELTAYRRLFFQLKG